MSAASAADGDGRISAASESSRRLETPPAEGPPPEPAGSGRSGRSGRSSAVAAALQSSAVQQVLERTAPRPAGSAWGDHRSVSRQSSLCGGGGRRSVVQLAAATALPLTVSSLPSGGRSITPRTADAALARAVAGSADRGLGELVDPPAPGGDGGYFRLWAWGSGAEELLAGVVSDEREGRTGVATRAAAELTAALLADAIRTAGERAAAQGGLAEATAELSELRAERARLQGELREQRRRLQEAEEQLQAGAEQAQGRQREAAAAAERLAEAERELGELREARAAAEAELQQLRDAAGAQGGRLAEAEGELTCLREAAKQLQDDLKRVDGELSSTRELLREREEELTAARRGAEDAAGLKPQLAAAEKRAAEAAAEGAAHARAAALCRCELQEAEGRAGLSAEGLAAAAALLSALAQGAAREGSEAAARAGRPEGDLLTVKLTDQGKLGATWFGDSTQLKEASATGPLRAAGGDKYVRRRVTHVNGQGVASAKAMGALLRPGLQVELCFAPQPPPAGAAVIAAGLGGAAAELNGARGTVQEARDEAGAAVGVDFGPPHGVRTVPVPRLVPVQPSAVVLYGTERRIAELLREGEEALARCAAAAAPGERAAHAQRAAAALQQHAAAKLSVAAPPQGAKVVVHGLAKGSDEANGRVGTAEGTEVLADGGSAVVVHFTEPKDQRLRLRPANLIPLP